MIRSYLGTKSTSFGLRPSSTVILKFILHQEMHRLDQVIKLSFVLLILLLQLCIQFYRIVKIFTEIEISVSVLHCKSPQERCA